MIKIKSISNYLLFFILLSILIIPSLGFLFFVLFPHYILLNLILLGCILGIISFIIRYYLISNIQSNIHLLNQNIDFKTHTKRIYIKDFFTLSDKISSLKLEYEKLLKEKNEQLAVLYSMVEAVIAIDLDGKIIMLNPAGAKLFEINQLDSIGKSVFELIRNSNLTTFFEQIINNNFHDSIIHLPNRDLYLNAIGTVLRDSNSINIGAVIVLNDITQLRNLENIRKQFVSNVSHELKTPITAIKGFVETLKNIDNNNQDQKKFLQIIESHSDRLNCIIDDLLNLSRIEEQSGKEKLNLKNQKLLPVIDQAVQDCDILIQDKSISVKVNCDKQISILQNSRLMQEALSNLISNAAKYSDNESEIIISVNQNNDKDIISIKDYGIGISKKHQERLFERFYRVDESRSRDQGGTGLGLSIVKHIVNFHNGSITVNSEVDKGSTFSIIIPK